jgi:hypothetical protein
MAKTVVTKIIKHRNTGQVKELAARYADEFLASRSWFEVGPDGKPVTKTDAKKAEPTNTEAK